MVAGIKLKRKKILPLQNMLPLSDIDFSSSNPKKIVITTHHKPDGDALGSSLACWHYLRALGQEATVVAPSDYPYFLNWLPGQEQVVIYTEQKEKAEKLLSEADYVLCLDFNKQDRVNAMTEALENCTNTKLMIDHHLEPDSFATYGLWDTKAVATCELVYRWIDSKNHTDLITKDIANCIYTGIMTDSGSFRFPATTPAVLRVAATLMEKGAEPSIIHEYVNENNTETRLRFLGYCLNNKLTVLPEYKTAYIFITKEELQAIGISTGDSEGVVNYALSVEGIKFACFGVERPDKVKLSFRSKGDFAANEFAKNHFDGGGHFNAAGGSSTDTIEQVKTKFLALLPGYKTQLN